MLSLIVAHDDDFNIGIDNKLPWPRNKRDMRHFKNATLNSNIIMGRKTFESLPGILKNRNHIVMSRSKDFKWPGVYSIASSVDKALELAKRSKHDKTFVIGGATIYSQFLDVVDTLYISHIHGKFGGDAKFLKYKYDHGVLIFDGHDSTWTIESSDCDKSVAILKFIRVK